MLNPLRSIAAAAFAVVATLSLQADMPQGTNRTAAPTVGGDKDVIVERATRRAVLAQARAAAAKRTREALLAKGGKVDVTKLGVNPAAPAGSAKAKGAPVAGAKGVAGVAIPGPGFQLQQPDYMFGTATNWHNTVPIRKFVDTLPGLGAANANNLGNYIPVAVPDQTTFAGADYYEIDVVEYWQQLHSELAPTKLRGYVQHNVPANNTVSGTVTASTSAGTVTRSVNSNYLGPLIIAEKDRPVRVKMRNLLPTTANGGDLFIPVDTTMMGAGTGPNGGAAVYTQNRVEFHLHGGLNPWISDGTPHQWVTPAGEATSYKKGAVFQNVPDMAAGASDGDGIATYFWSNQQSARMIWYHDHAYGLTRLNAYAGMAAGYLIVDPTEKKLITDGVLPNNGGGLYNFGIPLVIQDKTFVDTTTLGTVGQMNTDPATGLLIPATDPTWDITKYGGDGALWFPHVYIPNQNPADISGANAMGRWDYGPWFWPPLTSAAGLQHGAEPIPNDPNGTEIPGTPNPSLTPEAFMDTPVVNGAAYPRLSVEPKAYRFRILNGANDRFWNLSFFQGDPAQPDADGRLTEVKMVPAGPTAGWPANWPTDGRAGGVPDPGTRGPDIIQIGNESGFLPSPVVIPAQAVTFNYNRRDIVVLNVADHGLWLGPAERADVIVDFSGFAGKSLILYNDSPSPVPAFDPRIDYYTGSPDQRDSGGADTTAPGYGPNTRTIMLVEVAAGTPATAFDLGKLQTAFDSSPTSNGAFAASQHPPIVPSPVYNSALARTLTEEYVRIQDSQFRRPFASMENGDLVQPMLESKAIQELFELDYGRMNATLGVELPRTNFNIQTTIPLGYIDPVTEILTDGTTQFWKITHNGVDTHPVHFHLFDVQIVNRVGWDGAVRMPDANEYGWKETVKMHPLEDCIVAFRPLSPRLPFVLPNSSRELDVTKPNNAMVTFTDVATGNPITAPNVHQDFGWEYVWHCHILGHEENDFMRPMVLNVAVSVPAAASGLTANLKNTNCVDLSWLDNATNETGFTIQRRAGGTSSAWTTLGTVVPNVRSFSDFTVADPAKYDYRVIAYNQAGDGAPSNIASIGVATVKVSGHIANGATALQGIMVSVSNGQSALTNAAGDYSYTVPMGFSGTATAVTHGYTYAPVSYTYSNLAADVTAQNFAATPVITVSGKVTSGQTNLAGVTITASTGQTATTAANGTYSLVLPSPYTGTITATKALYFITPVPITLTGAITDQAGQNFSAVTGIAVSGTVTLNGAGLAGVAVAFSGGYTPLTAANGTYTTYVARNYSGTLTPAKAGYAFTPTTRTLNRITATTTGQTFTARAAWPISGTITSNGAGLAGVTVTFSGGAGTATTSGTGAYSFLATSGWSGTVTPTLRGFTFLPASASITNLAAAQTKNFATAQTIAGTTKRRSNNANVAGVTLTATGLNGTGTYTATSTGTGTFTLTVPTGWTGTITASGGGFTTWTTTTVMPVPAVLANITGVPFLGQ